MVLDSKGKEIVDWADDEEDLEPSAQDEISTTEHADSRHFLLVGNVPRELSPDQFMDVLEMDSAKILDLRPVQDARTEKIAATWLVEFSAESDMTLAMRTLDGQKVADLVLWALPENARAIDQHQVTPHTGMHSSVRPMAHGGETSNFQKMYKKEPYQGSCGRDVLERSQRSFGPPGQFNGQQYGGEFQQHSGRGYAPRGQQHEGSGQRFGGGDGGDYQQRGDRPHYQYGGRDPYSGQRGSGGSFGRQGGPAGHVGGGMGGRFGSGGPSGRHVPGAEGYMGGGGGPGRYHNNDGGSGAIFSRGKVSEEGQPQALIHSGDPADAPQRKPLNLLKRQVPVEGGSSVEAVPHSEEGFKPAVTGKSDPFGGARPVDTAAKLRELEEKKKMEAEAAAAEVARKAAEEAEAARHAAEAEARIAQVIAERSRSEAARAWEAAAREGQIIAERQAAALYAMQQRPPQIPMPSFPPPPVPFPAMDGRQVVLLRHPPQPAPAVQILEPVQSGSDYLLTPSTGTEVGASQGLSSYSGVQHQERSSHRGGGQGGRGGGRSGRFGNGRSSVPGGDLSVTLAPNPMGPDFPAPSPSEWSSTSIPQTALRLQSAQGMMMDGSTAGLSMSGMEPSPVPRANSEGPGGGRGHGRRFRGRGRVRGLLREEGRPREFTDENQEVPASVATAAVLAALEGSPAVIDPVQAPVLADATAERPAHTRGPGRGRSRGKGAPDVIACGTEGLPYNGPEEERERVAGGRGRYVRKGPPVDQVEQQKLAAGERGDPARGGLPANRVPYEGPFPKAGHVRTETPTVLPGSADSGASGAERKGPLQRKEGKSGERPATATSSSKDKAAPAAAASPVPGKAQQLYQKIEGAAPKATTKMTNSFALLDLVADD
ncbi:hypothetical protein CEUSTIGMA_g4256.t1 [Chlamydomonas eustigma]|uniref:RRM domain-containing protein n=1 Tax=Chlamydomonas eustigma TaxID=1157962 RepID=A0A250X240_9CHLO|nr:hypothetical protein CEUSTIGMA_g4256.t1 [Chlamydomonas eustigma]|eukprot:GAX76810.1 hypothetical protein CEUSTIGMA_g4256.t1 [Chlamydomonas eustigma]